MSRSRVPDVLDFEDHRAFLRAAFAYRKARDPHFSYGAFAKRAGLAKSHLQNVLSYGANLSEASLEKYVQALRLEEPKAEYFRLLVRRNQASAKEERALWEARLSAWSNEHRLKPLPGASPFHDDWALVTVLTLSRVKGFRADPGWISRRLRGRVSAREAKSALDYLLREGFLKRRGRQVVRDPARGFPVLESEGRDPLGARFLREAAWAADREPVYPTAGFQGALVLTEEEARELGRKLSDWLIGQLKPSLGRKDGELCLVIGNVTPISRAD